MSLSTLGSSLVLAALLCAAFGGLVGMVTGLRGGTQGGLLWVRRAVWGFSAGMVLANLTMVYALLARDFSVQYVAQVGSHATPTIYTLVSLWSALEGSILFWGAVMGIYLMGFMLAHRDAGSRFMSLALGTQLLVGVFFAFLIAGPANPFLPTPPPIPLDGPGPNPMLQNHWLMVVHPPMLYLGYVGMTVPFGIVVAGLLSGELGERWMAPLRRWMLVPWLFLTFGIVMGAWWAYAVLGWGGYWAWDPVENASLLPWLTATAFLHSTLVQERRRLLRMWTATLALLTFWLTLLGTFMTRSGVFNSVHAFTQSDIGPTFLVFIAIVLVASLLLLTFRAPQLEAQGRMQALASREGGVLVNNLVLMALTFTVLLGTVFPLVVEAVQNKRISVGEPYFNRLAVPLGLMVLLLMGLGPALPWGAARRKDLKQLLLPTAVGVGVVALSLLGGLRGFYPLLTFGLAGFVTVVTLRQMFLPALLRMR
ncbi:MAG TPA: cytochrome c biogenesis protein CcsA, partial [Aggregicoccus sp.]|nr:cytochrome c biogenesis protein CcsA [Aggregicoccus sp.]